MPEDAAQDAPVTETEVKAPEEKKPESVATTPLERVKTRFADGVELKGLLRYMHGQSKVSAEVRDLVEKVIKLDAATTAVAAVDGILSDDASVGAILTITQKADETVEAIKDALAVVLGVEYDSAKKDETKPLPAVDEKKEEVVNLPENAEKKAE